MAHSVVEHLNSNLNFLRYHEAVFSIIQKELCRAFFWLYIAKDKYVGDYLKEIQGGMKRIGEKEKKWIEARKAPTKFDIPMLYRLLQRVCNLSKEEEDIWNKPNTQDEKESIEHTLFCLKEMRNILSHEAELFKNMNDEELSIKFEEIKNLCSRLITKAGEKYGTTAVKISETISNIDNSLKRIKSSRPSSGISKEKCVTLGRQELKERYSITRNSDLKYVDPILLRYNESQTNHLEINPKELMQERLNNGEVPDVILIKGNIGSGKSSLCQCLKEAWLAPNSEFDACDLIFKVQCKEIDRSDLVRFLQEYLLPHTFGHCDPYEIVPILKELKIMWLFDGYEDSTQCAQELLAGMMKEQFELHTIAITSRPENTYTLSCGMLQNKKVLELKLIGTQPNKMLDKYYPSNDELSKVQRSQLGSAFNCFLPEIQQELLNPLKFKLMIELWKEGLGEFNGDLTLFSLYKKIVDNHKAKLIEKCSEKMSKEESSRLVEKWFADLCENAFQMVVNKQFIIPQNILELLERLSVNLLIPAKTCFCAFLNYDTSKGIKYTFRHGTHQHYLAAIHATSILNNEELNLKESINRFLKDKDAIDILKLDTDFSDKKYAIYHFYDTLLFVISFLNERILDDESLSNILGHLLFLSIENDNWNTKWFQVIRYSKFSTNLAKRVSNFMSSNWAITERDIMAARVLLEESNKPISANIKLDIRQDPEKVKSLKPVLKIISENPIDISLYLWNHTQYPKKFSDKYLKLLCHSKSECSVIEFWGYLSLKGCEYLHYMVASCTRMCLIIKSNAVLESICRFLSFFDCLGDFCLSLSMQQFKSPSCSIPAYLGYSLNLELPLLEDYAVHDAVRCIRHLSSNINSISVNKLTVDGACKFVLDLKEKGVYVGDLKQNCFIKEIGYSYNISHHSLPLKYSLMNFIENWNAGEWVNQNEFHVDLTIDKNASEELLPVKTEIGFVIGKANN